jgi:hypothetical protein
VEVATANASDEPLKRDLEKFLDCPVNFFLAGEKDLHFAIPRAYMRKASGRRLLGEMLVAAGVITEENLRSALKAQKASGRKLGEVLQDMNLVTLEVIQEHLMASGGPPGPKEGA